jgi:hypothetical protein
LPTSRVDFRWQPDHGIDTLERTGRHELGCTSRRDLLGMLEERANLARQLGAAGDEQPGDREQHRRVPVMPAGVHHAVGA